MPSRVVPCLAEHTVAAPLRYVEQQGVTAGHDESDERWSERRVFECRSEDVSFEMVHPHDGDIPTGGEPLGEADADEQGADQPRSARHRHGVDSLKRCVSVLEGLTHHRPDRPDVGTGRQLGYDASEYAVHVLRQDHEGCEVGTVLPPREHSGGGLVT
jgi:hypothetical protein